MAISSPGGSKVVDHGSVWMKLGHIQGDVLGPIAGSGMAIGGAIMPQNG